MTVDAPFRVPVSDLLRKPGSSRDVVVDAPADFGVELSRIAPGSTVRAELELSSLPGGILVRGPVTFRAIHACSRCLTERTEDGTVRVSQLYADERAEEDSEGWDYRVEGEEIDLEPMLRDEIVLSWPISPSCGEACEGLGAQTETDLNDSSPREESPFAALRDLLPDAPSTESVED